MPAVTRRDALQLAVAAGLCACLPKPADAHAVIFGSADCERQSDGSLFVTWATQPPKQAVDVRVAYSANGTGDRILSRHNRAGQYQGTLSTMPRPYFHLSAQGAQRTVAERILPLEGVTNFRDLGGYPTSDGNLVRWGCLYRAGTLATLTDSDFDYLSKLGIRVVCDLRSNAERVRQPDTWRSSFTPKYVSFDYDLDTRMLEIARAPNATPESVRAGMRESYCGLPYDLTEDYRLMFAELAAGHVPLTFHCTAGKDRSGVAAALILTALGVPRSTILADYALTDSAYSRHKDAASHLAANSPYGFVASLPADIREPLARSDPDYLLAALQAIEQRDTSVLDYVRNRLRVSETDLQAMRKNLLEPA